MPLIEENFQFTSFPPSSSNLQPPSPPAITRPESPIPDTFLPNDVGDLLSGLGADDLDDFGDIDDEDIGNDKSFEEAHPRSPKVDDGFGGEGIPVEIPKTVGFATAGGRKLKSPSRAALAKASKIWAGEEDDDDSFQPEGDNNKPAKKPRLRDPEEYVPPSDEPIIDFPVNHVGFKTGKGKDVAPPRAESLQKASKLFNEIGQAMEEEPPSSMPSSSFQPPGPTNGFSPTIARNSTANSRPTRGKPLATPSLKSMQFAAKLFEEVDQANDHQPSSSIPSAPSQTQPSGFALASGGAAPRVSDAAIWKAMSIFDDNSSPIKPIFQPPSSMGKSFVSTKAADPIEDAENQPQHRENIPTSSFKSASGKEAVQLSSTSRATVAHLFNDIDTNMITPVRPRPQVQTQVPIRPASPVATPFARQRSNQGFHPPSTPLRTPIANSSASLASSKRPIQIKTPSGPIRRIGLGSTPSQRPFKRGFSTPFKNAPVNSTPARAPLQDPGPSTLQQVNYYRSVFDMNLPLQRENYNTAFLHPQYFSIEELREFGVPDDISAINIDNASNYQFMAFDDSFYGHEEALRRLKADGCGFVKEKWVENHWKQILWKIAGQIQAKPDLFQEKWNWDEVIRQLKYRYEREYGCADRSIIKRIQEHDSSPSLPMVLVISAIHYIQAEKDRKCFLELTDGWYRIKAQVDDPIQRAAKKGRIVVGRKMAISGAKLESGNDGNDVLEAFEKTHLIMTGNSTSLARWDRKLGKQLQPFIASLSSLTPDGGTVTLMDIVIEKVFPIAYSGKNEAPWNEEEERIRQDQWLGRYEGEKTRLGDKMRKEMERLEDLASLLVQSAEESDPVSSEPPDSLENDFEDLLEAKDTLSYLRAMSIHQIIHLASYANTRIMQEMQEKHMEMEAELATLCPKRESRDFRMIRFVDARMGNRDTFRSGMLTVWDVKSLGEGVLHEGKRYLISNIIPAKNGDWNLNKNRSDKPEVYFHTRRDSRWQPVA
ncbi:uncharacterized protein L201_007743 [Kwoniella dendrophila CBS 6074]|uniref:BRCA2 OB1 domain-containing protein n=1 Tax=Kwoniella dendrophila CBS 6074 TaxID=1295534 RepID=A0AAX4K6M0_9TREE